MQYLTNLQEKRVMYCPNCGVQLPDDALFCSECGTKINDLSAGTTPAADGRLSDYSDMVDSPEVKAALEKLRKSHRVWVAVLTLLPVVIAFFVGIYSDEIELKDAVVGGAVIAAIMLVCNLFSSAKANRGKPWSGVVVDKETVVASRKNNQTKKVIYVRTAEGKKKKIEDSAMGPAYDYFAIGDEVRFVPGFPFPYEKRNKTLDDKVVCMFCSRLVDIDEKTCPRCRKPLIK